MAFEPRASSSLLCVSLAMPWTQEPALLEMQLQARESIFGCEDFVVYTNPQISLGNGAVVTQDLGFDLHCQKGGQWNTYLNTPIFKNFWDRVLTDGQFKSNAWTVKVDPDAVFFANRLHDIVRQHDSPRLAAFINNCQLGLHGPVEVLSRRALEIYYGSHHLCEEPPTEDTYLQGCLVKIGAQQVDQWDLLAEQECFRDDFVKDPQWYLCNSAHAAFHPFKKPADYRNCAYNARHGGRWPP
jgi:hypothetical protein